MIKKRDGIIDSARYFFLLFSLAKFSFASWYCKRGEEERTVKSISHLILQTVVIEDLCKYMRLKNEERGESIEFKYLEDYSFWIHK